MSYNVARCVAGWLFMDYKLVKMTDLSQSFSTGPLTRHMHTQIYTHTHTHTLTHTNTYTHTHTDDSNRRVRNAFHFD